MRRVASNYIDVYSRYLFPSILDIFFHLGQGLIGSATLVAERGRRPRQRGRVTASGQEWREPKSERPTGAAPPRPADNGKRRRASPPPRQPRRQEQVQPPPPPPQPPRVAVVAPGAAAAVSLASPAPPLGPSTASPGRPQPPPSPRAGSTAVKRDKGRNRRV